MQPYVSQLALYDIANVAGVAADLSHCNTAVQVRPEGISRNWVPPAIARASVGRAAASARVLPASVTGVTVRKVG